MRFFLPYLAFLPLLACSAQSTSAGGAFHLSLTDGPAPVERLDVEIDAIALRRDTVAGVEPSWLVINLPAPIDVNLLDLRHGVTRELADVDLVAGRYEGIRMHLAHASVTNAGITAPLTLTTALVEVDYPFVYEAGDDTELILDFDAGASLAANADGTFIFTPSLSVKSEQRR